MLTTEVPTDTSGLASGASLHSLLARIPVFLWATDRELRITSVTGAALGQAGLHSHDVVGKWVPELFETPESIVAHGLALTGSGRSFSVEINGRALEAYVEPLAGPGGELMGVAGVALDVTERLVAETAMRLSEQSYRSLIDEAPYGICQVTESGQLLQVNPAMLEMLGYEADSEGDLLMRDLPVIFASATNFETFQKCLLAGGAVQGFESVWARRDGRQIQVRMGGRARRGSDGRVLCFDLIAENVTEKKELAARLQQAQKMQMIGQLAGGIAHDFNNLLTVINGYCDLLMLDQDEESETFQGLKLVRQAGERASGLTQQLLAFSRQQVTVRQAVSLNGVVAEVVSLSRRLIAENIRIVQNLGADAGSVMADAAQMHQMLMNLVVNARDAMPAGGVLTIETSATAMDDRGARRLDIGAGEYSVLTVSDSGIGMDEEVRAHIFEPFFTTKEVGKGTGLGLATVYALVRQSHGAIGVESSPGAGTVFRVYLPRLTAAVEDVSAGSSRAVSLLRGTSTILVVEDDAAVRRFTTRVLADAGYVLLEACDGEEALDVARKHGGPIHLLLTDMVMPGLTGTELAGKLRSIRRDCKVLLVSGYSETLAGEGVDESIHYLQKPFSPEQLSRTVNQLLTAT